MPSHPCIEPPPLSLVGTTRGSHLIISVCEIKAVLSVLTLLLISQDEIELSTPGSYPKSYKVTTMTDHNTDRFDTRDTYERAADREREAGRRAYEAARNEWRGAWAEEHGEDL